MDLEFNLINEYIYNYYNELITNKSEETIMTLYNTFGTVEKMIHNPKNKTFNLIKLFEKYNIVKPRANDIYILYNILISYPILICPLTGNKLTKLQYYNLFIMKKLENCYNNSYNKDFFKELLEGIKPTKKIVAKKKKPISSTIKRLVWNINIGEDIGKTKCLCCKTTDITQLSFNCGHIIAEANGGETIVSNLKPICQNCNSSMGTTNFDEFVKKLK